MNRMEEWMALQEELEQIPMETEGTVERAAGRFRRRRMVWQPLTAAAMVAVCFVAAVNLSPTVAQACSQVPVLAQLARAVSFSSSLRQAVEREYVQIVDQTAEDRGVTAHIQSLIVDQRQVHLYFTLESEEYDKLSALPEVFLEDGTDAQAVITGSYGGQNNGELLHAAVDFLPEAQVPETIQVVLRVYDEAAPVHWWQNRPLRCRSTRNIGRRGARRRWRSRSVSGRSGFGSPEWKSTRPTFAYRWKEPLKTAPI